MTATQALVDHHASAATHHKRAAHHHREALRQYQTASDYPGAARQALTAHGHGLRALEHGQAASAPYAAQEDNPLPGYLTRSSGSSSSTAVASPTALDVVGHHIMAADHHEAAEQHHKQAGRHSDAEHFIRADYETKKALSHGKHALYHGDQAAMHHMEHYGTRPSAELA